MICIWRTKQRKKEEKEKKTKINTERSRIQWALLESKHSSNNINNDNDAEGEEGTKDSHILQKETMSTLWTKSSHPSIISVISSTLTLSSTIATICNLKMFPTFKKN